MQMKMLARRVKRALARPADRLRFRRSIRPSDVFVVTYPKSGTTWVSYFLALIAAERARGSFQDLNLVTSKEWVPDVCSQYFKGAALPTMRQAVEPRIFKVHAPYDRFLPRVVYVVRDPRDVMVSYYYERRRKYAEFMMSIDRFIELNNMWPCDWGDHVSGWMNASAMSGSLLLVRYEDLHGRPERTFRHIVEFCGFSLSDAQVNHYVERASFENMRRAEVSSSGRRAREIPFVRRGVVGGWREELSEGTVRHIERRYEEIMDLLGYELTTRVLQGESATRAGSEAGSQRGRT